MSSTTVMVQTATRNYNAYVDFPCAFKLSRLPYPLNTSWYGFSSLPLQSRSPPAFIYNIIILLRKTAFIIMDSFEMLYTN
jgi:hypothetical protein